MSTNPPSTSPTPYHRCLHCKGFYETSFDACKWCKYQTPLLNTDGSPKIFPDRETCRAIQIAEWEQLPDHLKDDPMGPPADDFALLCNCLHCGPEGHVFEAIEMRWLENEQMWACPCTTCGGRGFQFDIHSAEQKWQCCQCGHFYTPKDNDYRHENANCPECGCKQANGWFDDGYDEGDFDEVDFDEDDEFEDDDDDLDAELDTGKTATAAKPGEEPFPTRASRDQSASADDEDDNPFGFDLDDDDDDGPEYDLGITWKESDQDDDDDELAFSSPDDDVPFGDVHDDKIPDDIDHPRFFRGPDDRRDRRSDDPINEDDIPF